MREGETLFYAYLMDAYALFLSGDDDGLAAREAELARRFELRADEVGRALDTQRAAAATGQRELDEVRDGGGARDRRRARVGRCCLA